MSEVNDDGVVYLSAKQLAKRYGVHVVTIWRWARNGKLPPAERLTPRTTRWKKVEVEACEAQRKQR